MDFLAPMQPSALPALLFLLFLPLWPAVRREHSRRALTALSVIALLVVAGLPLGAGLLAAILLSYPLIEWAAARARKRLMLCCGFVAAHAVAISAAFLPLPDGFRQLPWPESLWLFMIFSGVAATVIRMYSHFYDRVSARTKRLEFADYFAYMVYFPQVRHGPIERSRQFAIRVRDARRNWRPTDLGWGLARVALGLAALLAAAGFIWFFQDALGYLQQPATRQAAFANPASLTDLQLFLTVHLIPFVVYAFESGAASIHLGVGRVFGVRGSENFRYPLLATSPAEVWRRWNITIFAFLRDYIYAPLGGKRRKYLNIFLVFFYCGALHGLEPSGIVWGVYTGASVALSVWWTDRRGAGRTDLGSSPPRAASHSLASILRPNLARLGTTLWVTYGAVILVDTQNCGVYLLGEYFRRLAACIWPG